MRDLKIREHHLTRECYADRDMNSVDGIVVHYVSARWVDPDNRFDLEAVRRMLIDLNRPRAERRWYEISDLEARTYASYHYLIGRRGAIHELVPMPRVAYHAGESAMNGRDGCNEFCVGIALSGTHDSGFTDSQYSAFQRLAARLMARHAIDGPSWIQGHDQVAVPEGRKRDPGERWDWDRALKPLDF